MRKSFYNIILALSFISCRGENRSRTQSAENVPNSNENVENIDTALTGGGCPTQNTIVNKDTFKSAECRKMFTKQCADTFINHYYVGCEIALNNGTKLYAVMGAIVGKGDTELSSFQNACATGNIDKYTDPSAKDEIARFDDFDRFKQRTEAATKVCQGTSCGLGLGFILTPFTLGFSKPCNRTANAVLKELRE